MVMYGGMNSWVLIIFIYMGQLLIKKKIKVILRFVYLDSICDKCKCIYFWGVNILLLKFL